MRFPGLNSPSFLGAVALSALTLIVPAGGGGGLAAASAADAKPSSYEQRFINPRNGVHLKDNNVWVYTSAFAKRFGMPSEWTDDTLKGAEAVAYRVEWDSMQQCGFFSDPKNCRPIERCILDLYLTDEQSRKLPWKTSHPQGFIAYSSVQFLTQQSPQDSVAWDPKRGATDMYHFRPGLDSLSWVSGPPREGKVFSASSDGVHMRAYDRELIPGLDFLQLSVDCNFPTQKEKVRLFFMEKQPRHEDYGFRRVDAQGSLKASPEDKARFEAAVKADVVKFHKGDVHHTVSFPDRYMKRVNAYDKKEYEPRSLATEVEKRLFGKDGKPKPTEERRWWNRLFDSGE
jgi:hypothetical protein